MTPPPQLIIFDRKEFLDFLEWVGVTGEVSTTESGEEAFTLFGNMGNIFTLDVISNPQAEWDEVLEALKKDLQTRFISSSNQWSKGRNSGLLECCNIIDELRQAGSP